MVTGDLSRMQLVEEQAFRWVFCALCAAGETSRAGVAKADNAAGVASRSQQADSAVLGAFPTNCESDPSQAGSHK